ncbi:MAG: helix-turn-helix transcriptional regulator [Firmicutes bacterium]|jgi:DNA-binding PadR family transcriptional regulator|nr:helix-turn-helix transcriptional regulator [Bacillota bacterium]MCL5014170.1 helix-turn-helix transcriptional regulator [Bacillota bacterium]
MVMDSLVPSLPVLLILRALEESPGHGYKIARWVEERSGRQLMLKEGTLYPTLHQLERQGLIQGHWDKTGSKRPTKVYELTQEGRAQLCADREQWVKRVTVAQRVLWEGGV